MSQDEKKDYKFMKEVIKSPFNKRKLLRSILFVLAAAVAGGCIAAFVFVKMVPVAERFGKKEEKPRIEVGAVSPTPSATPEATITPTPTPTPSPTPEPAAPPEGDAAEEPSDTERYRELQMNIGSIAREAERSIVQINGIRNEMDYFNESYENTQQIAGLLIAQSESDYYFLTENRAIEGAERIRVSFFDLSEADASLIRHDANTGLAVVRAARADVNATTQDYLQVAKLKNSMMPGRGEPVIAIGAPLGYAHGASSGTLTSIDSEASFFDTHYHILTTDIQGAMSGSGVLVDLEGEVVAVILQSVGSADSDTVRGLGIMEISELVQALSNNDVRAFSGIRGETVTQAISEQTGIPLGMLVTEVQVDGPAVPAGIKQQDVIIRVNEQEIATCSDYTEAISAFAAGDTIQITAMRQGAEGYEEIAFALTLGEI